MFKFGGKQKSNQQLYRRADVCFSILFQQLNKHYVIDICDITELMQGKQLLLALMHMSYF